MESPPRPQRILIVGDAGRGKTSLAKKLAKKFSLPSHSMDSFLWKVKFTEEHDRTYTLQHIEKIYSTPEWIVEGTTRHLVIPGLQRAELIIFLRFHNIAAQMIILLFRHITKHEESTKDLFRLLRHVVYKRYGLGYMRNEITLPVLLKPFTHKVVTLSSFDEMKKFVNVS